MNSILLGTANLLIYFIIAISIAFPARLLFTIPEEVFRKILHFILLGSFIVLIVSYPTWNVTAAVAIIFEILVYPILISLNGLKSIPNLRQSENQGN